MKEAASLDPTLNSGNVHSSLGFVEHQLGDLEGAIKEDQLAMQFDPKFVDELTWNVALAYKDLGDYDKAREWIQKYIQTNPNDPKRRQEAEGLSKKLGEQSGFNASQSIRSPDYLDSLVQQHGAARWPRTSFPLKIFVEKYEGIPGVPADSMQMLQDSFEAWNRASGGLLPVQLVAKAKQADITIQWTNNPSKVSAHDGVHLEQGITRVMQAQTPGSMISNIRSADIILLTVSREDGKPLPADELRAVCLHEIGHAFGLGGHSANSADTMYFSSSARQLPALSHRDKTTISRLYSTTPSAQHSPFGMNGTRPTMPPFAQAPMPPFSQAPSQQIGYPQGIQSQGFPLNPYAQRPFNSGSSSQQPYQQPYPQP
ncbi:MAG: matrixin family metalloprotease, partial [Candidatus Melainabacteria bacterium]|nr:matrixin family metalloprotease [Candidatus Melainabacteria bacterium]